MSAILIVDGDQRTCRALATAMRRLGLTSSTASSAEAAYEIAATLRPDLLIIEHRRGPSTGLQLVQRLRERGCIAPFLLTTTDATTSLIVEAMRQGALDVLDKPIDLRKLSCIVGKLPPSDQHGSPAPSSHGLGGHTLANKSRSLPTGPGGSIADVWAHNVLSGCGSDKDPKTVHEWARRVGASHTSLCERCRLLHVKPHDARDFTRMLRALWKALETGLPLTAFL